MIVDNKVSPAKVHFTLLKILDIADYAVKTPILLHSDIAQLNLNSNRIVLADMDGHELILTNNLDDAEIRLVNEFQNKRATDKMTAIQHNFLLFESHKFLLGTWRYIRHS